MGLSNEERVVSIYHTIEKMVELSQNVKGYDPDFKRLKRICDQAWHAFLGNETNNSHWILGSGSTEIVKNSDCSPWAIAINNKVQESIPCEDLFNHLNGPEDFNAFDHFLSISGLIRSEDSRDSKSLSAVFEIYQCSETLIYALRRYNDEFRRSLKKLDKLISDIQGVCFSIFNSDQVFARAYLLHNTLKIVYGSEYHYDPKSGDFVAHWLNSECIHHNVSVSMQEYSLTFEELATINRDLTKSWLNADKKASKIQYERIIAALKLSGRRYHYKHQHNKLMKNAKDSKIFSPVQLKAIEGLCLKNSKLHDQRENESKEKFSSNRKNEELSIYDSTKLDNKD